MREIEVVEGKNIVSVKGSEEMAAVKAQGISKLRIFKNNSFNIEMA